MRCFIFQVKVSKRFFFVKTTGLKSFKNLTARFFFVLGENASFSSKSSFNLELKVLKGIKKGREASFRVWSGDYPRD